MRECVSVCVCLCEGLGKFAPSRGGRAKVSGRLAGGSRELGRAGADGVEGRRGMNGALEGAWGGEESVLDNGNFQNLPASEGRAAGRGRLGALVRRAARTQPPGPGTLAFPHPSPSRSGSPPFVDEEHVGSAPGGFLKNVHNVGQEEKPERDGDF